MFTTEILDFLRANFAQLIGRLDSMTDEIKGSQTMTISPELLEAVKDQLERFSDLPIAYGRGYERELEMRARGLLEMIDMIRVKEVVHE